MGRICRPGSLALPYLFVAGVNGGMRFVEVIAFLGDRKVRSTIKMLILHPRFARQTLGQVHNQEDLDIRIETR